MKAKLLIIVAVCAVVTLSFTFTANSNKAEEKATVERTSNDSEPAGGFASEDKF